MQSERTEKRSNDLILRVVKICIFVAVFYAVYTLNVCKVTLTNSKLFDKQCLGIVTNTQIPMKEDFVWYNSDVYKVIETKGRMIKVRNNNLIDQDGKVLVENFEITISKSLGTVEKDLLLYNGELVEADREEVTGTFEPISTSVTRTIVFILCSIVILCIVLR